jgi:hypothetical protein
MRAVDLLVFLIIIIFSIGVWKGFERQRHFIGQCREAGGVTVQSKGNGTCVKQENILKIGKENENGL